MSKRDDVIKDAGLLLHLHRTDVGMTPKKEPLHPDQECCLGLWPREKTLTEKLREIHMRPAMIIRKQVKVFRFRRYGDDG